MKSSRAVLGIDAAWTLTQPSGVAVAAELPDGWRMIAAASSYRGFQALADRELSLEEHPSGSFPDVTALLGTASMLCARSIDLVAIDMPLARIPIVARRSADNAVSKAYGARKCGTHTPNALRPGRMSTQIRESFERVGYFLLTDASAPKGLVEVYPHPALVELAGAAIRLPYKVSKMRNYWPSAKPAERRANLYRQWEEIVTLLEAEVSGVADVLPKLDAKASGVQIKAYEDALDATICAWVAICVLEGRARPFGNEISAIWIPNPSARPR